MLRVVSGATLGVVILTKDRPEYILPLLKQLEQARALLGESSFQVYLGDTGSTHKDVLEFYERLSPSFRLIRGLNYHFSQNNNVLAKQVSEPYILFLNNDISFECASKSLEILLQTLSELGPFELVGAHLSFPDSSAQHAGVYFSRNQNNWALPYHLGAGEVLPRPSARPVPALTGAFLGLRREDFEALGGFDEVYSSEYQDVDLCLKAVGRDGRCVLRDLGQVTHYENGTRPKGELYSKDRSIFLSRWGAFVASRYLYSGTRRSRLRLFFLSLREAVEIRGALGFVRWTCRKVIKKVFG